MYVTRMSTWELGVVMSEQQGQRDGVTIEPGADSDAASSDEECDLTMVQ